MVTSAMRSAHRILLPEASNTTYRTNNSIYFFSASNRNVVHFGGRSLLETIAFEYI